MSQPSAGLYLVIGGSDKSGPGAGTRPRLPAEPHLLRRPLNPRRAPFLTVQTAFRKLPPLTFIDGIFFGQIAKGQWPENRAPQMAFAGFGIWPFGDGDGVLTLFPGTR